MSSSGRRTREGSLVEQLLREDRPAEAMASLSALSPRDRVSVVRSLSSEQRDELSPRAGFFMRGLSTARAPRRLKQLMFAIFNCTNAAVGSGILAFPRAYRLSGWALGLLFTLAAVSINLYTLLTVLRCARLVGCNSYPATISKLYGPKARRAIEISVFVFCFSVNLSYLLVVGDMVSATLHAITGDGAAGNNTIRTSPSPALSLSPSPAAGDSFWRPLLHQRRRMGVRHAALLLQIPRFSRPGKYNRCGWSGRCGSRGDLSRRREPSAPAAFQPRRFQFSACAIQALPIIFLL